MNQKIKRQWVKALKSGEYKQGKKRLIQGNQFGTYHCCLGVLSELAVNAAVCSREDAFKGNGLLNTPVVAWARLSSITPTVGKEYLSRLNDDGTSFDEIANIISKNL